MKFKEEFPSLKKKIVVDDGYGNGVNDPSGFIEYVLIKDIKESCKDNQRIKEAIDGCNVYEDKDGIIFIEKQQLLEDIGL